MKKLFAVLLVLVCLVSSLPAWATETEKKPEVFTSGDYKYILLDDGTAEITGYRGNEKILRLQRESPYIVGLLQMDGMKSPEAVVKQDNTFYLTHDAFGNRNSNGAIFMDESISLETRPYTILLYGHNMKTGEKFGMLRKFEDFSYYYQHRIFRLTLTYDDGEYVIFSVADVDLTPGSRNYISLTGLRSSDRNTRLKALNSLIGCSVHQNNLDVNEEDQLVLLITCVGDDDERLIVAGRRLREGEQADKLNMK